MQIMRGCESESPIITWEQAKRGAKRECAGEIEASRRRAGRCQAPAAPFLLDSPEVTFIHPLGHEHGFEQIKANVYKRLMGGMFSERKLSPRDISIHVHGDSAWAEFYWDFAARRRADNSPITTHGRETQVYWKELRPLAPGARPLLRHALAQ